MAVPTLAGFPARARNLPLLCPRPVGEGEVDVYEVVDFRWMVANGGFGNSTAWGPAETEHRARLEAAISEHGLLWEWDELRASVKLMNLWPSAELDTLFEWSDAELGASDGYVRGTHTYPHEVVDLGALQFVVYGAAIELLLGSRLSEPSVFVELFAHLEKGRWLAGGSEDGRLRVWAEVTRLRGWVAGHDGHGDAAAGQSGGAPVE